MSTSHHFIRLKWKICDPDRAVLSATVKFIDGCSSLPRFKRETEDVSNISILIFNFDTNRLILHQITFVVRIIIYWFQAYIPAPDGRRHLPLTFATLIEEEGSQAVNRGNVTGCDFVVPHGTNLINNAADDCIMETTVSDLYDKCDGGS